MGLFGKGKKQPQKTPEQVAGEINAKLKQVVAQKIAGTIATPQMEAEFYRILKYEYPPQYGLIPGVQQIPMDKSGMSMEAANWFTTISLDAITRIRQEQQAGR